MLGMFRAAEQVLASREDFYCMHRVVYLYFGRTRLRGITVKPQFYTF
jgi:hypothetical protein